MLTPSRSNPDVWRVLFMLALVFGSVLYVMYARGVFEATQKLVLVAEDSEGVTVGMDLTFSGFPIGRVQRIELAPDGKARILVDVVAKDAHWLRTSSVFTLVRGLVGGANIRAYTGLLNDPLLPDGAERAVLSGDTGVEIPRVVAAAKELLENLNTLTGRSGVVSKTLGNVKQLTERLNGPGGAMTVLTGNPEQAKNLAVTLARTNSLLARLDGLAAKTDVQVFGTPGGNAGLMPETRATIVQLNGLLTDARASLRQMDTVLQDAQAITGNAKAATADLGALRADVDANLRKVEGMLNEINKKFKDKGLVVIGISDETKEKVEKFQKDVPMEYHVAVGGAAIEKTFGINGIPHAFVVGKDGKIAWEGHPMKLTEDVIEKALK